MPFGTNISILDVLTVTSDISAGAATIHLSPEKDTAGTVASKGVDRYNARHPGAIYHPLMVVVAVDTADVDLVTISFDHGDGAAFDWVVTSANLASQQVIFDLDGDFPGLLIFPKGERAAPDSLTVGLLVEAATTASTTITYEVLGN